MTDPPPQLLPNSTQKSGKSYIDSLLDAKVEHRDIDFSNSYFRNSGCLRGQFRNCKFNYCTFERAYFRECTFTDCEFIGARFIESNFRKITMKGQSQFDYAYFDRTLVNAQTMATCLPGNSNTKRLFCLSLRANYESLCDYRAADRFLQLQLDATTEHLTKKRFGTENYYQNHYNQGGIGRWRYRVALFLHKSNGWLWGHGLSPHYLLGWLALATLVFTVIVALGSASYGGPKFMTDPLGAFGNAAFFVTTTLVGLTFESCPQSSWAKAVTVTIGLLGYTALALLVAVIYRWMSRR